MDFAVPMNDPMCPEHCYSCCLNPMQHPRFDPNIHRVVALLTALCNTCGGVIFLTSPEGISHGEIKDDNINKFNENLAEIWCFPKGLCETYKQGDQCDTSFWGIIVAKSSQRQSAYEINGNVLTFTIDVHRKLDVRLTAIRREISQNKENEEARRPLDLYTPKMDEHNHSSDTKDDAIGYSSAPSGNVDNLTWGENKKGWEKILIPAKTSLDNIASCDIWKPDNPMPVTPNKESLLNLFRSENAYSEVMKVVTKLETHAKGFAIAIKSRLLFLPEVDVTPPSSHLCDILTVTEDNEVCLWVIVSESGEQVICTQLHYMLTVGRTIKHQILHQNRKGPNITIRCNLYSIQVADNEIIKSNKEYVRVQRTHEMLYCNTNLHEKHHSDVLRQCIASLLQSKHTAISTCVGEQMSLMMSANMLKTRLVISGQQVTYVNAPPGTGKTVCGISLYRAYEKVGSVYICPTRPLIQYLRYHKCEGTLIRTNKDLCDQIDCGTFKSKECVVIDESHHLEWDEESWKKLFIVLSDNPSMFMFVFADTFQCFDGSDRSDQVGDWIYDLSKDILKKRAQITSFPDMYRNTKMIVSFLQHTAMGMVPRMDVEYANDLNGDGIQCKVMENLFGKVPENSLVKYLQPLLAHPKSSPGAKYHFTDVAVLLDDGYTNAELDDIRYILETQLGINTHQCDKFPRQGIVVDRNESFIGLDAGLCIFLLSPNGQQKIIDNPRYRIYLASRATHKAVFVVPEIDPDFAINMQFDHFQVSSHISE